MTNSVRVQHEGLSNEEEGQEEVLTPTGWECPASQPLPLVDNLPAHVRLIEGLRKRGLLS